MNPNTRTAQAPTGLMQDVASPRPPRPVFTDIAPARPPISVASQPTPPVASEVTPVHPAPAQINYDRPTAPAAQPAVRAQAPEAAPTVHEEPAAPTGPQQKAQYPFLAITLAVLITAALVFAAIMAYRQNASF